MANIPEFPDAARCVRRSDPARLTQAAEFRAVLAGEWRLNGKCFVVRALPNNRARARVGLVTSRKAAPRAVDRNRGKRLAREAFRGARAQLPAVDIVLLQKNNLRNMRNPAIRNELDGLLCAVAKRFGV